VGTFASENLPRGAFAGVTSGCVCLERFSQECLSWSYVGVYTRGLNRRRLSGWVYSGWVPGVPCGGNLSVVGPAGAYKKKNPGQP